MRALIQQIIDTRRVQLGPIADELKQVEVFENNYDRSFRWEKLYAQVNQK